MSVSSFEEITRSRPEKSLVLRAMLAKEAGGLALSGKVVFKSTKDPFYRRLLALVRDARGRMLAGKRFDMPGFRPTAHYIREMKRYGILPKDLPPDAPVDIYATDQAYWRSFWYVPKKDAKKEG